MSAKRNLVLDEVFDEMGVEDASPKSEVVEESPQKDTAKKADYMRVTASLPIELVEKINLMALQRKMQGISGGVSGVVKDALVEFVAKNFCS